MLYDVLNGLSVPFLGTVLGAGCVFFLKKDLPVIINKAFTGFAGGVMIAASVWSLLLPALAMGESNGWFSVIPVVVGFWIGILFLLLLDILIPHLHRNSNAEEGISHHLKKTTMLMLAVTLHNIPEGMAVGVIYAGLMAGNTGITATGAFALALGIAVQNFPEGAIISMPLRTEGMSKKKAFLLGILSAIVEPIGALLTIFASDIFLSIMPYMLSFAAGAMIYVVVEELIPEMSQGKHSNIGTLSFGLGFSVMMILDVIFS